MFWQEIFFLLVLALLIDEIEKKILGLVSRKLPDRILNVLESVSLVIRD